MNIGISMNDRLIYRLGYYSPKAKHLVSESDKATFAGGGALLNFLSSFYKFYAFLSFS